MKYKVYTLVMNPSETTVITIKTKKRTKELAQMQAKRLGMPLGTILNALLNDFAKTGELHLVPSEPITPKMAEILADAEREIAAGEVHGPFTVEESIEFLDSIIETGESTDGDILH
jgi:antitoxin component of RelBE/YafQ-DinJ toxin-antitoxin module